MARKNLLRDFKRPKTVLLEPEQQNSNYGKFVVSPFEKGFGVTIANSLRRTLLTSIQGYAITAMRVEYLDKDRKNKRLSNEFESITGVFEETTFVVQNLKQVRSKLLSGEESRTLVIEKKGEGLFTAKDIEVDSNIQVLNPELVLATLNEEASLLIEIQIDMGRGYISAERNLEHIQTIDTIPIDAIFSPIRNVNFTVGNTRIGQRTDYDKITLDILTDGSISPQDAIAEASKILKEHYSCFINFEDEDAIEEETEDPEEEKMRTLLNTVIEELELSVRSSNCLRVAGIRTIGDLVTRSEEEIARIKNLGKKSIQEIRKKLQNLGLDFGMKNLLYLLEEQI